MTARRLAGNVVAILALLQGVFGVMRGLHWFRLGLLPIVGLVAWFRGFLLLTIAALFGVFAIALWTRRPWAKVLGLSIWTVDLLLVLSALTPGANAGEWMLWSIVPVV